MAKVNTRGRPKNLIAPVANAPKKRGRPAAAKVQTRTEPAVSEAQETVAVMTPRKRGRPSIAASETPKKSRGRPRKEEMANAEEPVIAPKKRAGRPSKVESAARVSPATPKRPGRPPKTATSVNLNRVANVASSRVGNRTSPRVAKRTSPRSKKPAMQPVSATPIKNRGRAKLRTPVVSAQKITKKESTSQPAKKRGRPKGTGKGPLLKKTHSCKPIKTTSISRAAVAKPTITRKKRGITTLDVPDKFVAQVKQYLQELQAGAIPAPDNQDDEAEIEDQVEPDADAGAEDDDIIVDVVVEENDIMITSANDNANELEDDFDELEDNSDEFEGNLDELGNDSEQPQHTEYEEEREEDLDAGENHIHEHLDNEMNPSVENNVDAEPTETTAEVETNFQQHVEFDDTRLDDIFNDAPNEGDMQGLEKDLSELPDAGDDHAVGVFKPQLSIGAIFSPV